MSYAKGKIDEGYYSELKNMQQRSTLSWQMQQEQVQREQQEQRGKASTHELNLDWLAIWIGLPCRRARQPFLPCSTMLHPHWCPPHTPGLPPGGR